MIDFHCHLDLYKDPQLAASTADEAGIYVLSVTTTPRAWAGTARLAKGCRRIRTALGMHPEVIHERMDELPLFEALATETRYIGEIGLDGSPAYRTHAVAQVRAFELALRTASKCGGKILSIHSRKAASEVLDALGNHRDSGVPVLHWFSGSAGQLKRAIDQGCWFSVGPAMLKAASGRALAAAMPINRVLTETDGPFTLDGSRPLQPSDSWMAVEALAQIWGMSRQVAADQLRDNLTRLVRSV